MDRRNFLRNALLIAIGAAIAPLPNNPFVNLSNILTLGKRCVVFKVSMELLNDQAAFNAFIGDASDGRTVTAIQTGWVEDDFTKNILTVKLQIE